MLEVVRALLERSLPALGLVDHGQVEVGPVVRLSQDARRWLERAIQSGDAREEAPVAAAEFRVEAGGSARESEHELRLVCGFECDVGAVVEVARYGSVWLEARAIGVSFSEASLSHAADHDPDMAGLRAGLSALTHAIPPTLRSGHSARQRAAAHVHVHPGLGVRGN